MAVHPSLLQQFALMRLFPADALAQLAAHSSTHAFAKREVVLAKENPSPSLMFLLEGRLQAIDFTLDGREVGLHFIEEGQYFGEISVLDGLPSPEVVIANKKSQVVMVPAREVRGAYFFIAACRGGHYVRIDRTHSGASPSAADLGHHQPASAHLRFASKLV